MEHIAAIRDFFIATNGHELKQAYRYLEDHAHGEAPVVTDWREVEFAFNRLFVGPAALEAPPFASVFLDGESLVMGRTTLEVREMYSVLGLESPWKDSIPDDHLALELDAILVLDHIARQQQESEIENLRVRFYNHLGAWVPRFTEKILTSSATHPAINFVATCLTNWLADQKRESTEGI